MANFFDEALTALQQRLNYQFKDLTLLQQALHHRSVAGASNERLEFLGDAVMGLIVADQLYRRCPQAQEGELTRSRVSLVSGKHLAQLAQQFKLDECLQLDNDLKRANLATHHAAILSDAMEAVVGAIYLDSSWSEVLKVVTSWLKPQLALEANLDVKDPKTRLQEWTQQQNYPLPVYTLIAATGPEHDKRFKMSCELVRPSKLNTEAISHSKKEAQQQAAQLMLDTLAKNGILV